MTAGTALVTGASSGIGAAIAEVLAGRGYDLVLVARRLDRLEALGARLQDAHGVTTTALAVDLAQPGAAEQLVAQLQSRQISIDWLVNNAGYGLPGAYSSVTWEDHEAFLQVMVTTVAELTWRLLPQMGQRGSGRILNIASLAGLVPPSGGHTLYGAVKAWLISFSQALAHEVAPAGISVTAACPGFTYSEFHDVNGMREKVSQMPGLLWMDAATVAAQAVAAAEKGRLVYVHGWINRLVWRLSRYLPRRLFLAITGSQSRRFRNSE